MRKTIILFLVSAAFALSARAETFGFMTAGVADGAPSYGVGVAQVVFGKEVFADFNRAGTSNRLVAGVKTDVKKIGPVQTFMLAGYGATLRANPFRGTEPLFTQQYGEGFTLALRKVRLGIGVRQTKAGGSPFDTHEVFVIISTK